MLSQVRRAAMTPLWIVQLVTGTKSFERNLVIGSRRLNEWGLHTARVALAHRLAGARRHQVSAPEQHVLLPREGVDAIEVGITRRVVQHRVRLTIFHPGDGDEVARELACAPDRVNGERRRRHGLSDKRPRERPDGTDGYEPTNQPCKHDDHRAVGFGCPKLIPRAPLWKTVASQEDS